MDIPLLHKLGITTPIFLSPMAGAGTPALAAAVANAGGLGGLGIGASDVDTARQMIRETRALTAKPFNVNLFCHRPAIADPQREAQWLQWLVPRFAEFGVESPPTLREIYASFVVDDAMLAMLLEERPAVVSFHFGLPNPDAIAALKQAGIMLFATATQAHEARAIADAGVDAIVAQGIEAGGHRGVFDPDGGDDQLGTLALTRLLVRCGDLPVIASGGIMDGAGIAAALALGAQAAQLGTAFLACPESAIDAGFRSALLDDGPRQTTFTASISGRIARSLRNRFTALDSDPQRPHVPDYPIAYDAGKALHAAAKSRGEYGYGTQWAGQGVALTRSLPAGELVAILDAELKIALRDLAALA